jgi:phage shock protein E
MFFMKPKAECSRADVQRAVSDPESVIIDCRTPGEVAGGTLSDAKVLDWLSGEFQSGVGALDKSKTYFLYCRSGNRSGQAASFLKSHGFEKVYNAGAYGDLI